MSISVVVQVLGANASSVAPSAISMTLVTGLAFGDRLAIMLLLLLLSSQGILCASSYWNKKILNAFNTVTMPLILVFTAIVAFKVLEIL